MLLRSEAEGKSGPALKFRVKFRGHDIVSNKKLYCPQNFKNFYFLKPHTAELFQVRLTDSFGKIICFV
ncbi:hypothetical protein DO021_02770 [Desulfobacter hydrogenophilus]|uniref:Uncharacterized protein n=1 Tax=Desulfobacter hydrogenophilus TaxID=2291 RepID=A0A328FKI9_9BACT|nr:hypothetical protein DO021_02770 [Desulfobacter hydrogenophilus]